MDPESILTQLIERKREITRKKNLSHCRIGKPSMIMTLDRKYIRNTLLGGYPWSSSVIDAISPPEARLNLVEAQNRRHKS